MTDQEKKRHRALLATLNEALSSGTHAAISNRITLRDAVCAYLAAEQASGLSVVSVVQCVKEILRKGEESAADTNAELAQQLVDLCLGFYRTPGLRSI